MDDREFRILELKAAICAQQARWPAPNVKVSIAGERPTMSEVHWQALHAAVDEARERAANAWAAMDAIDRDGDLSPEGKARQKKQYATDALIEFQKSKTLCKAKDAVERQLTNWEKETGLTIKAASNVGEAVMQAEVRAHFAAMKDRAVKINFLEKHATDPRVASAILSAPSFLAGLSDEDISLVRARVEQHMSPDIAKAKDDTLKALADAEQGWQNAINKIAERAGLTKAPDGSWRVASKSE